MEAKPQSWRTGERNGRAKLTDAQVVRMRVARCTELPKPTFKELADRFHVNTKTARRICRGSERVEAGGPLDTEIEEKANQRGLEAELPPFDASRTIRCRRCRSESHPSTADETLCFGCHVILFPADLSDGPCIEPAESARW